MPAVSACPEAQGLQHLLQGKLPSPEEEILLRHVEQCLACAETVERLIAADTLASAVRSQPAAGPPAGERVNDLIRRLCALRTTATPNPEPSTGLPDGGPAAEPDNFDFLAPAQAADEIGRLGDYRVLRVLGTGGMGVVFEAEDVQLRRRVALKAMKPALAASASNRQRFLREARAAAAIAHDHIVHINQVGEDRGVPYIAMPLLQGQTLEELLRRAGKLKPAQVLRIGLQVARGLAAAHGRGLIHRDVKPANLWIEPEQGGRVKILDFGLARSAGDAHLTQTGAIVGTPAYMAPEQARGETVDPRSDLFSLGCVLYRMATGEVPFKGKDHTAILLALAMDQPAPPHEVNPAVPVALSELVMRLLAKDPAARPTSARELIEELERLERDLYRTSAAATVDAPPARPPAESPGRTRRRLPVAIAAGLLLAAGVGLLAQQIVIRIKDKQGKTVAEMKVDKDQAVEVEKDGKVIAAVSADADKAKPTAVAIQPQPLPPIQGGEPLSPLALVSRPAKIDGVRSWTIETVKSRGGVISALYSPDGKFVSVLTQDGSIRVLNAGDGRVVRVLGTYDFHPDMNPAYTSQAWSPRGQILALSSVNDKRVRIWDVEKGILLRTWQVSTIGEGATGPICWSPGGDLLAVACYRKLEVYDVASGKLVRSAKFEGAPPCVSWSPDGKTILVGTVPEGRVIGTHVFDATTLELRTTLHPLKVGAVTSADWSRDSKRMFITTWAPDKVICWDVDTQTALWAKDGVYGGGLACSPDGMTLLVGTKLLDAASGKIKDSSFPGRACSWSPDGKTIVTYAEGPSVINFWDVASGQVVKTVEGLPGAAGQILWALDGTAIGNNAPVRFWELATGKPIAKEPSGGYTPFYSPNGKVRMILETQGVIIADAVTGQRLQLLNGAVMPHWGGQTPWAPDGKRLALTAENFPCHLWDIETGKRVHSLPHPDGASVRGMAFSPDCKLFAYGTGGGHVRLWDPISGELLDTFRGHTGNVTGLLWSADGKTLTSSADDGMRDWDVATGRLIRHRKWRMGWPSPDGRLGADVHVNTIRVWDLGTGQRRLTIMPLPDDRYFAFSPDGHYRGSRAVERDIVYVVQLEDGRQETLTPAEFAKRFKWKNDPDKVGLAAK